MACACMTQPLSQVRIDLEVDLELQRGQTACFHANRCRTCLQRSGAQRPKPRRAFDEAGKRHSLQEEGVPSFRFLFGVQRRHLSSERPLVCMRARTGVCMRARAHDRDACVACRYHSSYQCQCTCSMACPTRAHERGRKAEIASGPAAKKPGRQHRRRWMHALCMQSCLHVM